MDYVAGIDLGTSSVKVVLMDAAGHIAGSAGGSYPIQTPRLGWAEQDPEDWWTAAKEALGKAMSRSGISGAQIKGIGFFRANARTGSPESRGASSLPRDYLDGSAFQ